MNAKQKNGLPNIPLPTLGGQQFWVDEVFYAGWRIQRHILTGHHRMLSPGNIRRAWGSLSACKNSLELIKKEKALKNSSHHMVLLVHGMAGWSETFFFLEKHLRKNGFQAEGYNYPSLKGTLEEQATDLNAFLDALEGFTEITLIGHSQGGIVIRKALEKPATWRKKIKVGGLILIGTPNQGAAMADFSKRLKALGKVAPKVRDQLTSEYAKTLKPLKFRTGLIAGSLFGKRGINPLVPGNDDGIVGVDEVWIKGQNDRLLVTSDHFTLANRKKSREAVVRFLNGELLKQ